MDMKGEWGVWSVATSGWKFGDWRGKKGARNKVQASVSSDDDDDDDVYGKRSCWQLLLNFSNGAYEFGGLRCATNTLQKRNLK
jgi:hypothetical protein